MVTSTNPIYKIRKGKGEVEMGKIEVTKMIGFEVKIPEDGQELNTSYLGIGEVRLIRTAFNILVIFIHSGIVTLFYAIFRD